jgi:hypothetical protein
VEILFFRLGLILDSIKIIDEIKISGLTKRARGESKIISSFLLLSY